MAKAAGTLVKGLGTLGQTVLDNTVGKIVDSGHTGDIYRTGTPAEQSASAALQPQGSQEQIGAAITKTGAGALGLAAGAPAAAVNAAQAGVESLGAGDDLKTAALNSFLAGIAGQVVDTGSRIAGNALSKLASHAPESLYNNALKVLQKIKNAGDSPSTFLKDEGVWGSLGTFHKAAQEGIGEENAIIKQAAYHAPGGVTYEEIAKKAAENLKARLGDLYSAPEIDQLIQNVPVARLRDAKDVVPWVDADGVRSALGTLIGDNKWLSSMPSENTQAAQAVYGALSDAVKAATGTETAFSRLSHWISTDKVVNRAIGIADSKYGLGLYDYVSGLGGAAAGGLSGEGDLSTRLKNAALGAGAGIALERGVNSPALKTGVAQLLTHMDSLPATGTGMVSKTAVMQGITAFLEATRENPQQSQ
jgi:hypothetical protein